MVRTDGIDSCAAEGELAASARIQLSDGSGPLALVQICWLPLSFLPVVICVADDQWCVQMASTLVQLWHQTSGINFLMALVRPLAPNLHSEASFGCRS